MEKYKKYVTAIGWEIYRLGWYMLLPFVLLRLYWRYRHTPSVAKGIAERCGWYDASQRVTSSIVVHAVSLGESIAAMPLLRLLSQLYPSETLIVTSMTASGRLHIAKAGLPNIKMLYFPYEFAADAFLQAVSPRALLLMETELWPNMLRACKARNLPVILLNARMSARSLRGYARIASLTHSMMNALTMVSAQSEDDRTRFLELGCAADRVVVNGSLKFDLDIPAAVLENAKAWREELHAARPIWVAASTHPGEEEIILKAQQRILERYPNALLILAPRHIERANALRQLIAKNKMEFTSRTGNERDVSGCSVYLADTMGELLLMYAVADVAFVGGSLIVRGGHNLLEPAVLAKPILSGKSLFNFQQISNYLLSAQALILVDQEEDLAREVNAFFSEPERAREMGLRAKAVCDEHRGSLQRQLQLVEKILQQ